MAARKANTGSRRTAARRSYEHLRLDETVGFLLDDAARTMTRTFSKQIAVHGIGMGVFQFLRLLWEEDGLTQSELAGRARMKGPSAVAAVRELEWRGFVRRVDDPLDRRKVRLFLTPEGGRLYDLVMPDIEAMRRVMLAGFSAAEQAVLKDMLRRMRRNLSAGAPRATAAGAGKGARPARARPARPGRDEAARTR